MEQLIDDEPYSQLIMHIPPFIPEDVLYLETFLPFDTIVDILFKFCKSHIESSHTYYDDLSVFAVEYEWNSTIEVLVVESFNRMGNVLFYALAINPMLIILFFSEIVEVRPISPTSWLVKYRPEESIENASMYGLVNYGANNTITFDPSKVNYPHAARGDWVSSILSEP